MAAIFRRTALAVLALAVVSGCTVKKSEAPPPSGPSELATALTLKASPDVLPQDGSSQSELTIQARDPNGQPIRSLAVYVEIVVNGVPQDFGRLSARNVVTGSDGRTSVVYTAPRPVDSVDRGTIISLRVTPVGVDQGNATGRTVDIRLVPPGTIDPPDALVPDFSISPDKPKQEEAVQFDASDPQLDADITAYAWDFGDGATAFGRVVTHQFDDSGAYTVTLTVTHANGAQGSLPKTIEVEPTDPPTADFVFSPTDPQPGQKVFFNGSTSKPGSGRTIVRYLWEFGNGSQATGSVVSHTYTREGTYNVTLVVTDDNGNSASIAKTVTVAIPASTLR